MPAPHPTATARLTPGPTLVGLLALAALLVLVATGCNVRSMGANVSGQLGDGTTTDRPTPVRVTGTTTFAEVSPGTIHTCGIAEAGTLHCWGSGAGSRLGLGTDVANRSEPTQVGTATDWVAVSAGESHTCGIRGAERHLFCWGTNDAGQSVPSAGRPNPRTTVPTLVTPEGGFDSVSAGRLHTCAVHENTRLFCWGFNIDGRLGDGDRVDTDEIRQVPGRWISVSVDDHTCAIQVNGTLHCWGSNRFGQLGTGDLVDAITPQPVPLTGGWAQVDTGDDHTCARSTGRVLHCWGEGAGGRLGTGTTTDRLVPIAVLPESRWDDLSVAREHGCALRSDDAVLCWGTNSDGRLGDGTTTDRSTPRRVQGLGEVDVVAVSAGNRHTHILLRPEE